MIQTADTKEFTPKGFLFIADCHIKGRTWTNSTLLRCDSYDALRRFLVTDVMNQVDTVVIGGDLFDSNRPTSQDLYEVNCFVNNFRRAYYIRGNHDNVQPSYLESQIITMEQEEDGPVFPMVYNPPDVREINFLAPHVQMIGISWMPSDSQMVETFKDAVNYWRSMRNDEKDTLYIVMHCSFKHLLSFDGAYQFDIDMIRNICGSDRINILVGHVHTRDTKVYNESGAYIHSPGSTYPLSSEKMDTPCYGSIIDYETGAITAVPCDVRNYAVLNIADIKEGNIMAALADQQKLPAYPKSLPTFVRLIVPDTYDGTIPEADPEQVTLKVERHLVTQEQVQTVANTTYTINDAVREELQQEQQNEMALEMAEELLASDDPVGTLNEWLTFWNVRRAPC